MKCRFVPYWPLLVRLVGVSPCRRVDLLPPAAGLKSLRDEHARTIEPARALSAEALALERQLSDLVNAAYGLTPEEVKLLWATAPPRMPVGQP